jgi:hypothetical protein
LMIAAEKGYLAVVQYLGREDCADVNLANHAGATALIIAARGAVPRKGTRCRCQLSGA